MIHFEVIESCWFRGQEAVPKSSLTHTHHSPPPRILLRPLPWTLPRYDHQHVGVAISWRSGHGCRGPQAEPRMGTLFWQNVYTVYMWGREALERNQEWFHDVLCKQDQVSGLVGILYWYAQRIGQSKFIWFVRHRYWWYLACTIRIHAFTCPVHMHTPWHNTQRKHTGDWRAEECTGQGKVLILTIRINGKWFLDNHPIRVTVD